MDTTDYNEEDFNLQDEDQDGELFEHHRIVTDKGQTLIRIDKFLMDRLPNATRNKLQDAIDNQFIKVNELPIKASYKVKPHDVITISMPNPPHVTDILPEDIDLDIEYEDDHVMVIYKAPGMVVHPAHGNWSGTLVNALVHHFGTLPTGHNGVSRPGLVHRIDKDTSGLMVIAKTESAMTHLAKQFFVHSIERRYQALVWGEPEPEAGTINVHVGRSLKDRRVTSCFPEGNFGRNAITHYKTIENLRYVSLIECKLETGRTHQIRAHMKHLGHPLFNDAVYGGDKVLKGQVFSKYKSFVENCFDLCPRQALHAISLGFEHPATGEWLQFSRPLPEDMAAVLERWRSYVQYN